MHAVRFAILTLLVTQHMPESSLKFDMGMRFGSEMEKEVASQTLKSGVEIHKIVSSLHSCPSGWPAVMLGCWTICPLALFLCSVPKKRCQKKEAQKRRKKRGQKRALFLRWHGPPGYLRTEILNAFNEVDRVAAPACLVRSSYSICPGPC